MKRHERDVHKVGNEHGRERCRRMIIEKAKKELRRLGFKLTSYR